MKRPFSQFEAIARQLVEGSFNRLFGGEMQPLEIANRLARTMEEKQQDGRSPDQFHIFLHPADFHSVRRHHPRLQEELAHYVSRLATQAGLQLLNRPQLLVEADASLGPQQVRIYTHYQQAELPTTQFHQREELAGDILAAIRAVDAYLIVEGQHHVPLAQPMITLGRRMDNDVVLESAMVSRQHAQIRWRYGRFILYDLSNRGRTLVNGQPVQEYALQPGDVIALSHCLLIYGEGRDDPRHPARSNDEMGITLVKPRGSEP